MPELTPKDLASSLKAGNIYPLYLFYGKDEYAKEGALEGLKNALAKGSRGQLDYLALMPEEFDLHQLLDTVRTRSIFGQTRCVVIRDFDKIKKKELEMCLKYANFNDKSKVLVLVTSMEEIKGNLKGIYELVKTKGMVINFVELNYSQLVDWVKVYARKNGFDISFKAIQILLDMFSYDRFVLAHELEKLILYFDNKKTIEEEDLKTFCRGYKEYTLFELADCLMKKDQKNAAMLLSGLFESEKDLGVKLVGLLNRQVRLLLGYIRLRSMRIHQEKIASHLGIKSNIAMKKLEEQSSVWSKKDLEMMLKRLYFIDRSIKRGGPLKLHIEALIACLTG